jgi:rhodanese-related sulfurtransferase
MEEANAAVPRISGAETIVRYANAAAVFVDVRDGAAIAATGTIKDARRIPRGMLEFMAGPATAAHNKALTNDAEVYLVCAADRQAALAGKTLFEGLHQCNQHRRYWGLGQSSWAYRRGLSRLLSPHI